MEGQHNPISTKRFATRLPSLVVIASLDTDFNAAVAIISLIPTNQFTDSDSANVDGIPIE